MAILEGGNSVSPVIFHYDLENDVLGNKGTVASPPWPVQARPQPVAFHSFAWSDSGFRCVDMVLLFMEEIPPTSGYDSPYQLVSQIYFLQQQYRNGNISGSFL